MSGSGGTGVKVLIVRTWTSPPILHSSPDLQGDLEAAPCSISLQQGAPVIFDPAWFISGIGQGSEKDAAAATLPKIGSIRLSTRVKIN